MTARETILAALRASGGETVPVPAYPAPVKQGDPVARFLESVKGVGGQSFRVPDVAARISNS